MLVDVIDVRPLGAYRLRLTFEDGVEGDVDITKLVTFTGVFAPLAEQHYFRQVAVNPDSGTVCWPNGADIDPDVLYSQVTGQPLPAVQKAR
jgi:hypothetical protein